MLLLNETLHTYQAIRAFFEIQNQQSHITDTICYNIKCFGYTNNGLKIKIFELTINQNPYFYRRKEFCFRQPYVNHYVNPMNYKWHETSQLSIIIIIECQINNIRKITTFKKQIYASIIYIFQIYPPFFLSEVYKNFPAPDVGNSN